MAQYNRKIYMAIRFGEIIRGTKEELAEFFGVGEHFIVNLCSSGRPIRKDNHIYYIDVE